MDESVRRYLAVGIFGPSDCAEEMRVAEWVLVKDRTVLGIAREARIAIEPVHWLQVTSGIRRGISRAQDRIHELVDETDPPLRLFVFKDRFGSDAGLGMTGTEEEWQRSLALVEAAIGCGTSASTLGEQSRPMRE